MAKAIPPVRCNIIFAKCTRRPSIVLSLFLSASGRARVRDERDRRMIFVELISARNNGNANVICCILGDLPNEGAVVFVIFLNRRRTCVVCVVRLPVFRFRNFLADGFPSSSIPRDVTSIRTSEYLGTHILSRCTPKTRAPPALRDGVISQSSLLSRLCFASLLLSFSLLPRFAIPSGTFVGTGDGDGRRAPPRWIPGPPST